MGVRTWHLNKSEQVERKGFSTSCVRTNALSLTDAEQHFKHLFSMPVLILTSVRGYAQCCNALYVHPTQHPFEWHWHVIKSRTKTSYNIWQMRICWLFKTITIIQRIQKISNATIKGMAEMLTVQHPSMMTSIPNVATAFKILLTLPVSVPKDYFPNWN